MKTHTTNLGLGKLKTTKVNAIRKVLVEALGLTKESVLQACKADPRIISASYKDGLLSIRTVAGKATIKLPL